jgi:hypothetical protein
VERRADLHLHAWLEELSGPELETFASSGVVPEPIRQRRRVPHARRYAQLV